MSQDVGVTDISPGECRP